MGAYWFHNFYEYFGTLLFLAALYVLAAIQLFIESFVHACFKRNVDDREDGWWGVTYYYLLSISAVLFI